MSLIEAIVFFPMAILAIFGAAGMVSARNPLHSALFLVVNFFGIAGLYLVLSAPLLSALQVVVYAGAIMVLFLFVILFFVHPRQLHPVAYGLPAQGFLAGVVVVLLLVALLFSLYRGGLFAVPKVDSGLVPEGESIASVMAFGRVLFANYLVPFELTSFLLLTAMLGAVVLARRVEGGELKDKSSRKLSSGLKG